MKKFLLEGTKNQKLNEKRKENQAIKTMRQYYQSAKRQSTDALWRTLVEKLLYVLWDLEHNM